MNSATSESDRTQTALKLVEDRAELFPPEELMPVPANTLDCVRRVAAFGGAA